ncbi:MULTISPECIES: ABC transporter ATP-binding protein [unclassified Pseudoalteromonas]|uniref:ABC transporter ATP-binding protein n=1 Tax=unclassified Pseudoalteromonas TaxID=194690 RepID=UPI000C06A19B|nr:MULTISPECIES: ABC transporter ATP-binding protein [unclassified Pseudoalteromonas]MDP2633349.1 ABC transporter ATP-binding protein [Pseudoalteromonas sp. 1_MG-2023]PHN91683.1 ABC transporter [Pseudoalteromonas sp. 3D05]
MLDIQSLSHQYKKGKDKQWAINDLSLHVKPGILALLGPNGAGKSSLMRILATITKPTQGTILYKGQDIVKAPQLLRKELGYLPQYFGVYDQLSGVEFLQYMAGLKGLGNAKSKNVIDDLLNKLNLTHAANKPLKGYSGGMKQRIGIAQALLNDPQLLIIDEPTVGLDPHERSNFRQLLTELSTDRCIIFSTHIVSDVESIADHVAIMKNSHLIRSSTAAQLQQEIADKCWTLSVEHNEFKRFQDEFIVSHSVKRANKLALNIVSPFSPHAKATLREATLEDAYLYFTRDQFATANAQRAG